MHVRCGEIECEEVKGRLIRNPGYGGPGVSLNGWRWRPSISNHTKEGFQEALQADIAEDGVRNPILVWSLPEGLFLTFGGSRLKACLALGIRRIPAIINDYTERYSELPEVTPDNWEGFFTDPPREFEFGEYGADYHYNLERARRHDHDEAGFAWLDGEQPAFIAREFPWVLEDD
jgi:hypothetical protein